MVAINYDKLLQRIKTDDQFYIENFLKIKTKTGELQKFKLNPMQQKSADLIKKHQKDKGLPVRVIWLKARQHGISTYCEGEIFHSTACNSFVNSLIIAHEDKATQNLFGMSKLFYEELPTAIRPMKKYSNEQALAFENPATDEAIKIQNPGLRSKITVATAKNVQTARSMMIHNVHVSEVAFFENPETLMTGLLQCIPDTPNSSIFIESTANGVGGWFYDFWWKAVRGENEYLPIFLPWFDNPEYSKPFISDYERNAFIDEIERKVIDPDGRIVKTEEFLIKEQFDLSWEQLHWRRWCINNKLNGNLDLFRQEYPSTPEEAFISSGRPVFNANSLKEYAAKKQEPIFRGYLQDKSGQIVPESDGSGFVRIWKMPIKDRFYCIGGDVSEGLAKGDFSCAVVIDEAFDIVASWHGKLDPDLFGNEVVKLAKFYNEAYTGIENNNHGGTTLRSIIKQEYWNIYYEKNYSKLGDLVSEKMGWNTNRRTKPLMINMLASYIREKYLGIYWDTFISECFTYIVDSDNSFNAQSGAHDDTIIAVAIALQLMLEGIGEQFEPEQPKDETKQQYFEDSIKNDPIEYDLAKEDAEEFSL